MIRFDDFFLGLSQAERDAYCRQARVSQGYVRSFLLYRTKIPKRPLMWRLAQASGGVLSYEDVVRYFFLLPEDVEQLQEMAA